MINPIFGHPNRWVRIPVALAALWPVCMGAGEFKAIEQFKAPEAVQGVAVDADHFYAVATRQIGKYDKVTGRRVARWTAGPNPAIIHLDSGVVVDGKLYCGHSNWPMLPMTGSVEIWDTETLEHIGRRQFPDPPGSCTWVDRFEEHWWVCFAHYNATGGYPDQDNRWTTLVQYNDHWEKQGSWRFPQKVLKRFAPYSCSGGSWGPDQLLYCSGHDRCELYAMRVPEDGDTLELVKTISVSTCGQGIAWDRSAAHAHELFGINRSEKTVVSSRFFSTE